jgi:hypothetical protein
MVAISNPDQITLKFPMLITSGGIGDELTYLRLLNFMVAGKGPVSVNETFKSRSTPSSFKFLHLVVSLLGR